MKTTTDVAETKSKEIKEKTVTVTNKSLRVDNGTKLLVVGFGNVK